MTQKKLSWKFLFGGGYILFCLGLIGLLALIYNQQTHLPKQASAAGTVYTVTSLDDSGPGTLRDMVDQANSNPGRDTIVFDINDPIIINSSINVTDSVIINGIDQTSSPTCSSGFMPTVEIVYSNSSASTAQVNMFDFTADDNLVAGINVHPDFYGSHIQSRTVGFQFNNSDNNQLKCNFIGAPLDGNVQFPVQDIYMRSGVRLIGDSTNNIIGGSEEGDGNLIAGILDYGIYADSTSSDNFVYGNLFGTDSDGVNRYRATEPFINNDRELSISIGLESPNNIVGGVGTYERNYINSAKIGINLEDQASNTIIRNNIFGLNADGESAIQDGSFNPPIDVSFLTGVRANTPDNQIGGDEENQGNVFGFLQTAFAGYENADRQIIKGNSFGVVEDGSSPLNYGTTLPSSTAILLGSNENSIGGTGAFEKNIISNQTTGINLNGHPDSYDAEKFTQIVGNHIGVDITGEFAIPNIRGVKINSGNTIIGGGDDPAQKNIVSGNTEFGITVQGGHGPESTPTLTYIKGNNIGVDITGTVAIPNNSGIVLIHNPGHHISNRNTSTIIGGDQSQDKNIISGNIVHGIHAGIRTDFEVKIEGNYIGVDASGNASLPNQTGVNVEHFLYDESPVIDFIIGGQQPGQRNIISGNSVNGLRLFKDSSTTTNSPIRVEGNYIGIGEDGDTPLGNENGVLISKNSSAAHLIGGDNASASNLIVNNVNGILTEGSTSNSIIKNNIIGNNSKGIHINGDNHEVYSNFIGIDRNLEDAISNGVGIAMGSNNKHGGLFPENNIIGDFGSKKNYIYNNTSGIEIYDDTQNNFVIGNEIANNSSRGITVYGESNVIQKNYVGTNYSLDNNLGNGGDGIQVSGNDHLIGGLPDEGNIIKSNQNGISYTSSNLVGFTRGRIVNNSIFSNSGSGISLSGITGTSVYSNFIGTNSDLETDLGNASSGIYINGFNNLIGGADINQRNVIINNSGHGVYVWNGTGNSIISNLVNNNGGIGINLRGGTQDSNGITANDQGDGDIGANSLQNYPVIDGALTTGTTVAGTLNSEANKNYRIELFANNASFDTTNDREGETYVTSVDVLTDANGDATWSATIPAQYIGSAWTVTATEFSVNQSGGIGPGSLSPFNNVIGDRTYYNTSEYGGINTNNEEPPDPDPLTPGVGITKEHNQTQDTPQPGDTITYTLTYQNDGEVELTNTEVTDTLDPNLEYVDNSCTNALPADVTCTFTPDNTGTTGGLLTWNPGNLPVNTDPQNPTVYTVSFEVTIAQDTNESVTSISNEGFINTSEVNGETGDVPLEIYHPTPSVDIDKTHDKTNEGVQLGEVLTYTISYANDGPVDLTNTVLTDTLDPNYDYVDNSCTNAQPASVSCTFTPDTDPNDANGETGGQLRWDIGNLPAGTDPQNPTDYSVSFQVTLDPDVENSVGSISNTAFINTSEVTGEVTAPPVEIDHPDLTLAKEHDKENGAQPGDTVTYIISYENTGAVDLTDAILTDTLDPNLLYIENSCTNSCTFTPDTDPNDANGNTGGLLTWNLGTLAINGGSLTQTFQATVNPDLGTETTSIGNTAFLNTNELDGQTSITGLSIVYDSEIENTPSKEEIEQGEEVEFTITFENTSNSTLTNVVITDILNSELEFVSCSDNCTQSTNDQGQSILTWTYPTLDANDEQDVSFIATLKNTELTSITNRALMTSDEIQEPKEGTATVQITQEEPEETPEQPAPTQPTTPNTVLPRTGGGVAIAGVIGVAVVGLIAGRSLSKKRQ